MRKPAAVKINVPLSNVLERDIGTPQEVIDTEYSGNRLDRTVILCYPLSINPSEILGNKYRRKERNKMKLSTKGRYGLRAFVDLATYSKEEPVSISSIAKRQEISERYLEQLMAMLKKAGLVKSLRGASGGYVLTKDAEEISAGDVLRALEGSLEPVVCAAFHPEETCAVKDSCVTKYVWQKVNESVAQAVDGILISELVRQNQENRQEEKD